jgi:hypothetical protein
MPGPISVPPRNQKVLTLLALVCKIKSGVAAMQLVGFILI